MEFIDSHPPPLPVPQLPHVHWIRIKRTFTNALKDFVAMADKIVQDDGEETMP